MRRNWDWMADDRQSQDLVRILVGRYPLDLILELTTTQFSYQTRTKTSALRHSDRLKAIEQRRDDGDYQELTEKAFS